MKANFVKCAKYMIGNLLLQPETYVRYLITNQGPGSLISTLRNRKICENVEFETEISIGIGFCCISCLLTDEGVERVDEVLDLIFQVQ